MLKKFWEWVSKASCGAELFLVGLGIGSVCVSFYIWGFSEFALEAALGFCLYLPFWLLIAPRLAVGFTVGLIVGIVSFGYAVAHGLLAALDGSAALTALIFVGLHRADRKRKLLLAEGPPD